MIAKQNLMMAEMMNQMRRGFQNRSTASKSSSYDNEDEDSEDEMPAPRHND
jgi:hypothetical protein